MKNWIKARTLSGKDVSVWQNEAYGNMFIDKDGNEYSVENLDFTYINDTVFEEFKKSFDESNKRFEEQQKENQYLMNKWISSLDAYAIADHKANIDEREYWRKLRGDITLEIIKKSRPEHGYSWIPKIVDELFNSLYLDNTKFFTELDRHTRTLN